MQTSSASSWESIVCHLRGLLLVYWIFWQGTRYMYVRGGGNSQSCYDWPRHCTAHNNSNTCMYMYKCGYPLKFPTPVTCNLSSCLRALHVHLFFPFVREMGWEVDLLLHLEVAMKAVRAWCMIRTAHWRKEERWSRGVTPSGRPCHPKAADLVWRTRTRLRGRQGNETTLPHSLRTSAQSLSLSMDSLDR